MKLRNYTLRYLIIALLAVIAIWASLFYVVILDEVYDNIDDGLKNSKILIIRETYADKTLLKTTEFGIHQFKIEPLPKGPLYDFSDKFISTFEFMEYDDDNEPVRLLETVFNDSDGNPYKLTIRASMVEEDELLEDLMIALIALYAMLVISIALLNYVILRKAWKSFYMMLDRLKKFRLGTGTTFKAPESSVSEFKVLGRELEDLLQRSETIFTSQKQFIENASHELQTPLAISLNRLELFVENNNLNEEQVMDVAKISDTLSRLVRLNKSLLMLSKIENRQFTDEEMINFNALANQLKEDFEDLSEFKNITIRSITLGELHYMMNKGLATTLITNLLKNAIVHSETSSSIDIVIEKNAVTLLNDGSTALNPDIFNRFTRDLSKEQSTGLGLSIVQSIASIYHLKVEYSYTGKHAFKIIFPTL